MKTVSLGFIGSGRMTSAIVKGILQRKLLAPEQIWCLGASRENAERLASATGVHWTIDPADLGQKATHLVLACKPAHLATLPVEWKEWSRGKSLLSILAGIRLRNLSQRFPHTSGIVRSMPNTPAQVGAGVTAFSPEAKVTSEDREIWEKLLGSLGIAVEVKEEELDLVTALSGSGPAYFFEFVRLLEKAATELGFAPEKAALLARHTFTGSAKLLLESGKDAETLRREVTTPGGTTEAGLRAMEQANLAETLKQTLIAASRRSEELSQSYE